MGRWEAVAHRPVEAAEEAKSSPPHWLEPVGQRCHDPGEDFIPKLVPAEQLLSASRVGATVW